MTVLHDPPASIWIGTNKSVCSAVERELDRLTLALDRATDAGEWDLAKSIMRRIERLTGDVSEPTTTHHDRRTRLCAHP
jgi:hypothetical protein